MKNKIRVLLVKDNTKELEKLLNEGWLTTHAFANSRGTIVILSKPAV